MVSYGSIFLSNLLSSQRTLDFIPRAFTLAYDWEGFRVTLNFSHLLSNSDRPMVYNHVSQSWHY